MIHIVYSDHYDIGFFGIELLHPFDSRKYSRAWKLLQKTFGESLAKNHIAVDRPVTDEELLLVHSQEYLTSLESSKVIAAAVEIQMLEYLPAKLLHSQVLLPMRWAVRGSALAAKSALQCGLAVNLSGGYHHSKPSNGEGFSIFSDIALIVRQLRAEKIIGTDDQILYVDLDAHQGNGVSHHFISDRNVSTFDMYNGDIYPCHDRAAILRIDCPLPLQSGCVGEEYLRILREKLPLFIDSTSKVKKPALAIYNAGTDVFLNDQLGGLALSADDVLQRDIFAIQQLQQRGIPVVMLLSGGYSPESHRLIAATIGRLMTDEAA